MRCRCFKRRRAFTLLELLVVIGIIAIIIGLLLPVLSGIAARGRDIKCQANLRSIIQAMHGYAAEHGGSMPWGLLWMAGGDATQASEYTSWAGVVSTYMNRQGAGVDVMWRLGENLRSYSPALICPEAAQSRPQVVSYAASWLVCASPFYDTVPYGNGLGPGTLTRTTRASALTKDTAVVYDTGIFQGSEHMPHWWIGGDIDGQRIWLGNMTPQYRYITVKDIFAQFPGNLGHNRPALLDVHGVRFYNAEPGLAQSPPWPYQGNLRFRHRRDTTCNVAFADGSVRQFTAKMNRDKTVKSHDALRRYFQLKWPTGVPVDPTKPH
jgi:prepilin-type N-terminal cleavage/methylation domain-containing protein/prepilin-type processing-associated H-X9-DG protein